MGIEVWHTEVLEDLSVFGFPLSLKISDHFTLLLFEGRPVAVNLCALGMNGNAEACIVLQDTYRAHGIYLVHLWKDIWQNKKEQVIGRIRSVLGLNKRIHGRKTGIVKLSQIQADEFLIQHHLQGTAGSKYRFGLVSGDDLFAVACFSNLRYMKKGGPEYRSAELIRFATKTGFTVTGGFSKLLKHFIDLYEPDDVMSYADRDWSLGKAYERAGFRLAEITPPAEIWLDLNTLNRYFAHRIPENTLETTITERYLKIFNTGNLKYILYLKPSGTDHD